MRAARSPQPGRRERHSPVRSNVLEEAIYSPSLVNLLSALESYIDARVEQKIGAVSSETYTKGHLPLEIATYKHFAKICASGVIPGAVQAAKRGPWSVPKTAWHAARSRRPAPRLDVVEALTDEQLAELALKGRKAS